MIYLAQNIKYLRAQKNWTQQQLADQLVVKRALVGSYEEGRASPKLGVLQAMAELFELSLDELIGLDLSDDKVEKPIQKKELQVLPILVNEQNEELIPIVPVKASAGYLNGFSDPEFIQTLPRFEMPVPELSKESTYRVFQIQGDSMLPVSPGSYVFCEYIEGPSDFKDGETYILITKDEGLVYKRVYLEQGNKFLLKSDNQEYDAYTVEGESVMEIWKAKGVLSFDLPNPDESDLAQIPTILREMRDEIRRLKN